MRVLKRLNQEGTTILLVEQNARQALAVVQRCYVLEVGHVIFGGTPAELAREPLLTKAYLGAAAASLRAHRECLPCPHGATG
jgi:branched-chain amino acid transport system ATP-binding protein